MVTIKPFTGLRYNLQHVSSLDDVTAPPYDVISPAEQDALYEKSPHNIVRLILGKLFDSDSEADSVYTRAKATLDEWVKNQVLQPEPHPAIYGYNQAWQGNNRQGFIALLKLHPYEDKVVLPHEQTLAGPKKDRLNLTRATETTLSPIFCLYNDAGYFVESEAFQASGDQKKVTVMDKDGIEHTFWPVTDEQLITTLQNQLRDKPVVIADGHHRYETALAYQAEKGASSGASNYTMAFFCNSLSPGLKVYPTHRVFEGLPQGFTFESVIEKFHKLVDLVPDPNMEHPFAVFWLRYNKYPKPMAVILEPETDLSKLEGPLQELDVAILDTLIMQQILETPANDLKAAHHLVFIRDEQETLEKINDGALVFWMKTPDIQKMEAICQAGLKMPQKSTYFYPKLLSGLVCYPHWLNN